ncbi:MAG: hypothetical protein VX777_00245 [Chlamydiota bacterium]|nr:hypothetical protein [Chlamydiota bacterium]
MTGFPIEWRKQFTHLGVGVQDPASISYINIERERGLISLFENIFQTVDDKNTSDEMVNSICSEIYPGGCVDLLSQEVMKISDEFFNENILYKSIPKNMLMQVQRQIIEISDKNFLDQKKGLASRLHSVKALILACEYDDEINELCAPKKLNGAFGPRLIYRVTNIENHKTIDETAKSILEFKQRNSIDDLLIEEAFIVKNAGERTDREGIEPGQEVIREQMASDLQEILDIDFGVPMTVNSWIDIGEGVQWASLQSFVKGASELVSKSDQEKTSISNNEFHKFIFDVILFATDRHLSNVMCSNSGRLYLIDNGLSFPEPSDCSLREAQFDWMTFPQSYQPFAGSITAEELKKIDIEKTILELKTKNEETAARSRGVNNRLSSQALDLVHFNLLLVKLGTELEVPMRNIAATIAPVRDPKSGLLYGGEVVRLFTQAVQNQEKDNLIDWKEVEQKMKKILTQPLFKREKHRRISFLVGISDIAAEL